MALFRKRVSFHKGGDVVRGCKHEGAEPVDLPSDNAGNRLSFHLPQQPGIIKGYLVLLQPKHQRDPTSL